jgi:hypothetical protein
VETTDRQAVLSPLAPFMIMKRGYRELEYVFKVVAACENGDLPCGPAIDAGVDMGPNEVGYMDELTSLPVAQDTLQVFPDVWLRFSVLANESEKVVNSTSLAVKDYKSLPSLRPYNLARRHFSEIRTRVSHMPLSAESNLPVRHKEIRMYSHQSVFAFDYQIGCRVIVSFDVLGIEIRWRR